MASTWTSACLTVRCCLVSFAWVSFYNSLCCAEFDAEGRIRAPLHELDIWVDPLDATQVRLLDCWLLRLLSICFSSALQEFTESVETDRSAKERQTLLDYVTVMVCIAQKVSHTVTQCHTMHDSRLIT